MYKRFLVPVVGRKLAKISHLMLQKKQTKPACFPLTSWPQTKTMCTFTLSVCLLKNKFILQFTHCHMRKRRSLCFITKRHLRNVTTGASVLPLQGLGCVFMFKLCQEAFKQSELPTISLLQSVCACVCSHICM